jgi:hypothetical protein
MNQEKNTDWKSSIKFDVWSIVSILVANVPGLLIERESFLRGTLGKTLSAEQLRRVIEAGDYSTVSLDGIDAVADRLIGRTRLITSGASFLTGLPSSLPLLPATITADVAQSFAFYIRVAQELAYLYGETRDFTDMEDDEVVTSLLIYLGAMFGIRAAGRVLILVSNNAGEILAKKFGAVAVTKVLGGIPWQVAKVIARLIGIKLTKEVAAKGIAKVLPILGGVVSGAITFTVFGPMAKRLQGVMRDALTASDEVVAAAFEELSNEDEATLILGMSEDVIEGVIADMEELAPAEECNDSGCEIPPNDGKIHSDS